jgi:glycosyl transferase, family 25
MQEPFRQLNNYYDKIYVLSVAAAASRRELFAQRFQGLAYEFFFGADKNKFTIEESIHNNIYSEELAVQRHRFSKAMKHGEIACAWSHRMMYEDMLANNYKRILIFEDDAVPDPERMKQIPAILNEIPDDLELLFWGWGKNGKPPVGAFIKKAVYHLQHRLGLLKWNHSVISNLYARPFSSQLKKAGFHDYTYAYAVTREGAEKLLQAQAPIQYIADNLLAHTATGGIVQGYITYPAVFLHDSLPDGSAKDSYIR